MRRLVAVLLLAAACGEDEAPPPKPGAQPAAAAGAANQQKKDDKGKLAPRAHVEENVNCPVPADLKPTGPECKPDAPTCEAGLWCLQFTADKYFCEPCPERDAIRHDFKERDFVGDQARDPFQSYVVIQPGLGQGSAAPAPVDATHRCTRKDQFPAPNYSYADLRLVGIVAQGTARKALMMDAGNPPLGWIVKRGDCVGKEKAFVTEIGTGDITFIVDADPSLKRQGEQRTVPLHPMSQNLVDQDEMSAGAAARDAASSTPAPVTPKPVAPEKQSPR